MAEYLLPDVGEGLTEAEIVSWKVAVGDTIAINDVVCEIETAKSIVELPSPYAGEVTALLVDVGQTVDVGTPIISIGSDSAASTPSSGSAPAAASASEEAIDLSNPASSGGGEGESLVGRIKADRGAQRRARTRRTGPAEAAPVAAPAPAPAAPAPALAPAAPAPAPVNVQVLAKPPVRKLAKDLGVDLARVAPTGPEGTVTRADVQAAAAGMGLPHQYDDATASASAVPGQLTRERIEPVKGVRKMMAEAMSNSAFTSPHVTEWITVDATATMAFVERLRSRREFRDVKVSPLLVLARAAILAMRRTPEINSYFDGAAGQVVYKSYVNLGIAAATPRGLVVPNVKEAQTLSLLELARELNALAATAREGRTQPSEMSGGTFTITNVGVFGVDAGTPIINPGESAILCFGAVTKRPWVVPGADGDEIAIRQVTTLALSFDHRHIDGAAGSTFLADVAGIIEDPASALLF